MEKGIYDDFFRCVYGDDIFKVHGDDIVSWYHKLVDGIRKNGMYCEPWVLGIEDIYRFNLLKERGQAYIKEVVTDVEGSFEIAAIGEVVEKTEERDILSPEWRREEDGPTKEGLQVVCSDLFLIDILCDLLYHIKMNVAQYCVFFENTNQSKIFSEFRREGRRCKKSKTPVKKFSDYGYSFPLDAEIRTRRGRGNKTEIINVVPNIFRLFVLSIRFRDLFYGQMDYKVGEIKKCIAEAKINMTNLEKYKIEDIMGERLSVCITKLLLNILGDLQQNQLETLKNDIKGLVKAIKSWRGVYSRCKIAEVLQKLEVPDSFWRYNSIEGARKRINYLKDMVEVLKNSINYDYVYYGELIYAMVQNVVEDKRTNDGYLEYVMLSNAVGQQVIEKECQWAQKFDESEIKIENIEKVMMVVQKVLIEL